MDQKKNTKSEQQADAHLQIAYELSHSDSKECSLRDSFFDSHLRIREPLTLSPKLSKKEKNDFNPKN